MGIRAYRQILEKFGFSENQALIIANRKSKEWLFFANEQDMKEDAEAEMAWRKDNSSWT